MGKNEVKLKSCPFCGGRAYIASWGNLEAIYIDVEHKPDCGCRVNGWMNSNLHITEQIKLWNQRFEEPKKTIKFLGKKTNLWNK